MAQGTLNHGFFGHLLNMPLAGLGDGQGQVRLAIYQYKNTTCHCSSCCCFSYKQCDQIGRFFKFLCHLFSLKLPNCILTFWATLKSIHLKVKTDQATYWATYGLIWATFYFNIWSHCSYK